MTADLLARTAPLDSYAGAFAALPGAVRISEEPFTAMVDVRVDPSSGVRLRGSALPATNGWVPAGVGRLVCLGPDDWLITSPVTVPVAL